MVAAEVVVVAVVAVVAVLAVVVVVVAVVAAVVAVFPRLMARLLVSETEEIIDGSCMGAVCT